MKRRVVVTGLGVVTSLSCQIEDLWKKILAGESGIHELRAFDASDFKVKFAGDVHNFSTEGYIPRREAKRIDLFSQFALVAGIDAVNAADAIDTKILGVIEGGMGIIAKILGGLV